MVSTSIVILSLLSAPLFAQSNSPLTSEQRADILMARKKYREAADVYKEGPLDSAVILNKIGIAYHQMLRLYEAKKYYEKAIKANPNTPKRSTISGPSTIRRRAFARRLIS